MRILVAPHTLESQIVLVFFFFNIFHPGGCIVDSIVVLFFFLVGWLTPGFTDEVEWNWESFDTMKKKEFKHFGRWECWFINPPSRFVSYLPLIPSPGGPRCHSLLQGIEKYTYERVMASLESAVASGSAGLWCSRETTYRAKEYGQFINILIRKTKSPEELVSRGQPKTRCRVMTSHPVSRPGLVHSLGVPWMKWKQARLGEMCKYLSIYSWRFP